MNIQNIILNIRNQRYWYKFLYLFNLFMLNLKNKLLINYYKLI